MIVHGQTHGGIGQGVGQVLMENCVYEEGTGQLLAGSFMDYCMPRADDLPFFTTEGNEVITAGNPLGGPVRELPGYWCACAGRAGFSQGGGVGLALANWMIPGAMVKGPGGAMDLVTGAKQVLIVMDHVSKRGDKKILNNCTLPLTGKQVVNKLVTSLAVIAVTPAGLRLVERAPGVSVNEIRDTTEPELLIDDDVPEVAI